MRRGTRVKTIYKSRFDGQCSVRSSVSEKRNRDDVLENNNARNDSGSPVRRFLGRANFSVAKISGHTIAAHGGPLTILARQHFDRFEFSKFVLSTVCSEIGNVRSTRTIRP